MSQSRLRQWLHANREQALNQTDTDLVNRRVYAFLGDNNDTSIQCKISVVHTDMHSPFITAVA